MSDGARCHYCRKVPCICISVEKSEAEKIAQAVADGYPDVDQVCPHPECGTVFKNYHHLIQCDRRPCPMSDDKGTIFDRLLEEWSREDAKRTADAPTKDRQRKRDA